MKFIAAFAAVLALALAGLVDEKAANGYSKAELKNFGDDTVALIVRGSYSNTGAEGRVYTVNYVADEIGFQPEATHLP